MNDTTLTPELTEIEEITTLNLEDMDIELLERRLELAAALNEAICWGFTSCSGKYESCSWIYWN
ncbi:MAG: hypothetical protein HYV63_12780 [Candidatus Schekmanbacteria bacterium]|nr:hypothetical protein [Candidatus Schekmanbacteria bacterium]